MIITMLGTSGSGKTVYMSAMSALFYNGGSIKRFSLSERIIESNDPSNPFNQLDNSNNSRTFVFKNLSELNNLYEKGCFPDGTSQSVFLPLVLKYDNEVVIDIDWIDYRGGALSELAKGEDTNETAKILYTLLNSDVVLVFVDASAVKVYKRNIPGARKRVGADVISTLLCRVMEIKHIDIIFLLSKFDSSNIDKDNDLPELKKKVGELYSKFLSQTNKTIEDYPVIEIGAVGYGNVKTTYTWVADGSGKILKFSNVLSNIENLYSFNIDYSFFSALLSCIKSEREGLNQRTKELEKEISELNKTLGPISNIFDILLGSNKRRQKYYDENEMDYNNAEFTRLKFYQGEIEKIVEEISQCKEK